MMARVDRRVCQPRYRCTWAYLIIKLEVSLHLSRDEVQSQAKPKENDEDSKVIAPQYIKGEKGASHETQHVYENAFRSVALG